MARTIRPAAPAAEPPASPDRLLSRGQLCQLLGVSRAFTYRRAAYLPRPVLLAPRLWRWRLRDVEMFLARADEDRGGRQAA